MDQTPIAYEFLDGTTYDFKGAQTVWVKTHRSGWDKRQATLQLLVSADGVNRCKPLLLFQGKGVLSTRLKKEISQYDPGVVVQWNPKAYANTETTLRWLKQQYKYATIGFSTGNPERLLCLDVFRGQMTEEVRQAFRDLNVTTAFIPGGCTGYLQVLDIAINKPLKDRIKELANQHYDTHFQKWDKGGYTVGERRVMLTHWVGQAWREFHRDPAMVCTIKRTFRQVGLALPVDGSEDENIKIKDIPDVEVGDWRLAPDQSNLEAVESGLGEIDTAGTGRQERESGQRELEQHDGSYDYEYVMGDEVTNTEDVIDEEGGDNEEEDV